MPYRSELRYNANMGQNKDGMAAETQRTRVAYAILIALTIVVGLASRKFSHFLPWWMAKNAGDVLYATMAFCWSALFFLPFPRSALPLPPNYSALASSF